MTESQTTQESDDVKFRRLWDDGQVRRARAVDARMEVLTRLIAAEKMNLLDDALGQNLPDDLWKQAEPLAIAVMTLIRRDAS